MTTTTDRPLVIGGLDKPSISPFGQLVALTERSLRGMLRQGEFVLGIVAPVMLTICFYVPLRSIFDSFPGVNYAQFLMPVILLQSVGFVATSAAMRAASDGSAGITERLHSMPVSAIVPMFARLVANAVLLVISLFWAVISGLVIGWRPEHGPAYMFGFLLVAFVVGLLLALGADAIGVVSANPAATSQAMALPQLILGMLSTGFVPETSFPEWIRPFARNQPISQFTELMRGFDAGKVTWDLATAPLIWAGSVAVLAVGGGAFIIIRSARR